MTRGIYKRGNIWWIQYAGLNGEKIRESSGSDKFRVAEALRIKRKQAIAEGRQPEIKKIGVFTFRQLAEEYLKWAYRQRSFKYKENIIKHLINQFGIYKLRIFSTKLIEQFQTERLNLGNAPATVNRYLATIKHMFTKAVEWEMVEEDTLKKIRKVKQLKENNRRLRYLSKEEAQALIDACNSHLKPIVITALNTGMRKSEILLLKWDNVDLRNGFILLDHTKNGERREVPINATLMETLRNLPRRIDGSYVFFDPKTHNPYKEVKTGFKSACKRAGIRDFRFHDLRHTFASQLVMAGADLATLKELLGHKDLTMTLRYAHLAPDHKKSAVNLLDKNYDDLEAKAQSLLHKD